MAIQNCVDIVAHIISEKGLGIPDSISEMFYLLEENGYLDKPYFSLSTDDCLHPSYRFLLWPETRTPEEIAWLDLIHSYA